MTKTMIKVVLFSCVVAGLLFFFCGQRDVGIAVVIAGYVLYIVVRLIPKKERPDDRESEKVEEEVAESRAAPDSWEELREKALEALSRKLRGQKIVVGSFFQQVHTDFPALVKVHKDLSEDVSELLLKTDFEILKLRLSAQKTEDILKEVSGEVETEEDLRHELERLREKTQP